MRGDRPGPKWTLLKDRARSIIMHFVAQLRVRINRQAQPNSFSHESLRALLRRIPLPAHLHSKAEFSGGRANDLLEYAEPGVDMKSEWQFVPTSRNSNRPCARIHFNGWLGKVELDGDNPDALVPSLDAGKYLGAGPAASHGFGCCRLDIRGWR